MSTYRWGLILGCCFVSGFASAETVRGVLVDSDGYPIVGARLSLQSVEQKTWPKADIKTVLSRTDSMGGFEFLNLPIEPSDANPVFFLVELPNGHRVTCSQTKPGQKLTLPDNSVPFSVQVFDKDHHPLKDAKVVFSAEFYPPHAGGKKVEYGGIMKVAKKADSSGTVHLSGVPARGAIRCVVTAPGYATFFTWSDSSNNLRPTQKVDLDYACVIKGRLFADGKPLAHNYVYAETFVDHKNVLVEALTDRNGRYVIKDASPGLTTVAIRVINFKDPQLWHPAYYEKLPLKPKSVVDGLDLYISKHEPTHALPNPRVE
jgi:hypothetical protein